MDNSFILVIALFCGFVVGWLVKRKTGKTSLSAKEKKTLKIGLDATWGSEANLLAKAEEAGSNLTAREELGLSAKPVMAYEEEVLQGLEGVGVLVGDIEPEVEKYGLTRQDLQTDTELQLRQCGIKVLTDEETVHTPRMPWLYISVDVLIGEERPLAAAGITVKFNEEVLLLGESKRRCIGACTWYKGCVVSVGLYKIESLRENVKDFVNEFINDCLAANPKEKGTAPKQQSR